MKNIHKEKPKENLKLNILQKKGCLVEPLEYMQEAVSGIISSYAT